MIAEVGAVMIVGGNIDHATRVMTTAIALETSKGNLSTALGLGHRAVGHRALRECRRADREHDRRTQGSRRMSTLQSILPLEIRQLVFEADGTRLLHDINLTLGAGQRTVVLGPNGAGKAFCCGSATASSNRTSGEITWRGAGTSNRAIRRQGPWSSSVR